MTLFYGHNKYIRLMFDCVSNREIERNNGIKLLTKIFGKIINNPTQIQKYGDLHLQKMTAKLSNCKPCLDLLILSGFSKSKSNTRLNR